MTAASGRAICKAREGATVWSRVARHWTSPDLRQVPALLIWREADSRIIPADRAYAVTAPHGRFKGFGQGQDSMRRLYL